MYNILTEIEWFDIYYPKEWGDYTKEYNMKAYRDSGYRKVTGCTWMDYCSLGFLLAEDEKGIMKVREYIQSFDYRKKFFIECSEEDGFIQPIYQPKDQKWFASVTIYKEESNLDLWSIRVEGCDDSSYTKHFIGYNDVMYAFKDLQQYGIQIIMQKDQKWFFTN